MRKRRKTAEILLSRPVARPMAKSQDGPIYPQMMPARRRLTLAAYWEEIAEKAKKRKATRSPRPRLLDPVTKQAQEPNKFGTDEAMQSAQPTASECPPFPKPEPCGSGVNFGGASPNHPSWRLGGMGTFVNRGTSKGRKGQTQN
ncbi:hypothetical protein HNQ64_004899 [Prosthecobacter dejongeii]|uniref:Uncharacterized protein n=1 Tax=Prosthecobacter dejongeii TaxID=48465 RepID=A0A7W8DT82_9BACT|nr:hypothetical protein [Prosthecobacter dejongeii]